MKPGKHQRNKQRCQDLCWKIHDPAQSFVLRSYTIHELRNQHVSIGFMNLEICIIVRWTLESSEYRNTKKKLTHTASVQVKSTKQRHRDIIFSQ